MKILHDKTFDKLEDERSGVFSIYPDVHNDSRGFFSETWKLDEHSKDALWIFRTPEFKQINTSYSNEFVVRGCHAQGGEYCQGKLVSALVNPIFDIITDARPESKTFRMTKVFYLNPELQNKLWVPRGFLHAFMTCPTNQIVSDPLYVFQYFCDNVYHKESEFTINPLTIVPTAFKNYCSRTGVEHIEVNETNFVLSDKDKEGMSADFFFNQVEKTYKDDGTLWYK